MNKKACAFFGHRECPSEIKDELYHEIEMLIVECGIELFYVGHQGSFDHYALYALKELKQKYPHIDYAIVLAYMPDKAGFIEESEKTLLPEGMENVPPRYAIDRRNRWILQRVGYVVAYVTHQWGGAARFVDMAKRKGKTVINIAHNIL